MKRRPLLVLAFALAAALSPLRAQTHGGTLAFSPAGPAPGGEVRAVYHAAGPLRNEPRLVLRARLRTPGDQEAYVGALGSETRRVAVLERGADGVHRATFRLPDSVVYALAVVETPDGARLDTNGNQGWELLAHAGDRPLSAALEQRAHDLIERNVALGLETARQRARLYPDEPAAQAGRWEYEMFAGGRGAAPDADLRAEAERLARLLERRGAVTSDDAAAMLEFAGVLDDATAADAWTGRLLRDFPRHPAGVQARLDQALAVLPAAGYPPRLAALEALWNDGGAGHEVLLNRAFNLAMESGDPAAIARWAERVERHVPIARQMLAMALLRHPPAAEIGPDHARARIAALAGDGDAERDLFASAPAYRDRAGDRAAELLAALGSALLASGRTEAARDTLARAAALGWDLPVLRRVADAQLAAGDTTGALLAFARIAADPGAAAAFADSVRAQTGARFHAERWAGAVAGARATLRERVLRGAVARPLAGPMALADAQGRTVELPALLASAPATVVVFGASWCGYTRQALPGIHALAGRLAAEGARLVFITQEAPSESVETFFRAGSDAVTVLYDVRRASHSAFGSAGTPQYFVVDGGGRVRFQYGTLDEIPRQVAVLRAEP
ncbi:MAG TPA: redoxin domain-containing protein [Longimicrobium sp.]|nr:redoxin domain-containing protein [Longimicrobium sp.]